VMTVGVGDKSASGDGSFGSWTTRAKSNESVQFRVDHNDRRALGAPGSRVLGRGEDGDVSPL
jgi:hypothetical protein